MLRLFVAIRPPADIRTALIGLMEGVPGARWQDDEQLHLTLRFVGEVDRPVAEDLAAALDRVDGPRPMVTVDGVGAFGRQDRTHALWAGVRPDAALDLLQRRIERATMRAGLPPETRAFHPHVTLARLGRAVGPVEPFLRRHAGLALPPFRPDAFLLYESRLGREGASYSPVARYRLT